MSSILKAAAGCVVVWSASAGLAVPLIMPVVVAKEKTGDCCKSYMIKPSELPIYDKPKDIYDISYHVSGRSQLEEGVGVVRRELCGAVEATQDTRDKMDHYYQTGRAHTASQIAQLLDEDNVGTRVAAVAAGGAVGLLLGARKKGGLFKKLVYTIAGVGVTVAALNPRDTRRLCNEGADAAVTASTVAYNFAVGVKPQNGSSGEVQKRREATPVRVKENESKEAEVKPSDNASKKTKREEQGKDKDNKNDDKIKNKDSKKDQKDKPTISGKGAVDHGQSNPSDTDMYTTRDK